MTPEEIKQRKENLKKFAEEYIALCKKYKFEIFAPSGEDLEIAFLLENSDFQDILNELEMGTCALEDMFVPIDVDGKELKSGDMVELVDCPGKQLKLGYTEGGSISNCHWDVWADYGLWKLTPDVKVRKIESLMLENK